MFSNENTTVNDIMVEARLQVLEQIIQKSADAKRYDELVQERFYALLNEEMSNTKKLKGK